MFTACTHHEVKNSILRQFCVPDSTLRIVIATVAFGMGLDCPNVHRIIHWGSPDDVETYIQETGRARRDGLQATAELFSAIKDTGSHTDEIMKDYCKLTPGQCCRKFLLKEFDSCAIDNDAKISACKCCDLCAKECSCHLCGQSH